MGKEVRLWIMFAAFIGNLWVGFSQDLSFPPPEPMMATSQTVPGSDCVKDTNGSGPSVPVGLCLPINDYLLPLLFSGVVLGAFSLFYFEKSQRVIT